MHRPEPPTLFVLIVDWFAQSWLYGSAARHVVLGGNGCSWRRERLRGSNPRTRQTFNRSDHDWRDAKAAEIQIRVNVAGGTIDVKNSPGYMKDFVVINAVQITSVSGTHSGQQSSVL